MKPKTKSRAKARPKAARAKQSRTRKPKKGERGALSSPRAIPAALLLAGAVLALMLSFHAARERFAPSHPAHSPAASLGEASLGR